MSALIEPFRAIRPTARLAPDVVARPYDVVTAAEAREQAKGKPWSFLHVSRAEIDCPPGTDPYDHGVYAAAALAFARMQAEGVLVREDVPALYAYRMSAGSHVQTGIAAAASIEAYERNRIRRHELTRPDKERDRTRQIAAVGAHTGPVLVAHPPSETVKNALAAATAAPPIADAATVEGTRHQVWAITEAATIERLVGAFEAMPAIYIADGHHRSAAAARLVREGGAPAANPRFLIVSFPADELRVLDYNRVVRDLAGLSADAFLKRIADAFLVVPMAAACRPERRGSFTMFLDGRWYRLDLRQPPTPERPARERLDVSLLFEHVLGPVLGIIDPRTDGRIDFVGGGRGLVALEERVRSGDAAVAFALHPTAFADVITVADAGDVMPPKSTWFEPKLADGLLSLPLAR